MDVGRTIEQQPAIQLADLKPGDPIIVLGANTNDPGRLVAITLVSGVEPILRAAPIIAQIRSREAGTWAAEVAEVLSSRRSYSFERGDVFHFFHALDLHCHPAVQNGFSKFALAAGVHVVFPDFRPTTKGIVFVHLLLNVQIAGFESFNKFRFGDDAVGQIEKTGRRIGFTAVFGESFFVDNSVSISIWHFAILGPVRGNSLGLLPDVDHHA